MEVTVSGKHEVTKVKLAEEVVDPDDIEMLEDLIMAATKMCIRDRMTAYAWIRSNCGSFVKKSAM